MEHLSEQTVAGLTEKEIKQLAKRCPIVMTVTEDILVDRFEYTEALDTDKDSYYNDMRLDLQDAQVSNTCIKKAVFFI